MLRRNGRGSGLRFLFGRFFFLALLFADKGAAFARALGFGERAIDAFNQRLFQMVFRSGKRRACQQAECGNKGDKGLALHGVSFRLRQPAQRSGVAKLKRARVILLRFVV